MIETEKGQNSTCLDHKNEVESYVAKNSSNQYLHKVVIFLNFQIWRHSGCLVNDRTQLLSGWTDHAVFMLITQFDLWPQNVCCDNRNWEYFLSELLLNVITLNKMKIKSITFDHCEVIAKINWLKRCRLVCSLEL